MAFVTPVKYDGMEHSPMVNGDVIDPQFLPQMTSGGGSITISNNKIPDLTPGSGVNQLSFNKTAVVGANQIVIQYHGSYSSTIRYDIWFDLPPTISDDQGNTYKLATISMNAVKWDSFVIPLRFSPFINPWPAISVYIPNFNTVGAVDIMGTVTYIR
jgi:hypothetical protein